MLIDFPGFTSFYGGISLIVFTILRYLISESRPEIWWKFVAPMSLPLVLFVVYIATELIEKLYLLGSKSSSGLVEMSSGSTTGAGESATAQALLA